ncbi:hypothetical protein BU23DRAFT_646928 [Bimuria novae-zelandiae CBS 107.79]|uniref:Rhamnogalacturonase A/B/Epimerase-like pectate lyase domain-containing protein n=1 Tax=Bimuria novae-zelandiae CBS 107.79 TaxID=1447943 RepID=A0A6A5V8E2_9PLEO|nr:hypothetical protein BU23DRAFT_646928 [Bimuria novae-zelandiae CBS 107.79]
MLSEILFIAFPLCTAGAAIVVDYQKAWTARGDKLPDFRFAGYHQSQVALPALDRPATITISPANTTGDRTPAIQAALDQVAQGGGGVVQLVAGTYALSAGLLILIGTTLRGAGIGNTVLTVNNLTKDVVTLGQANLKKQRGKATNITDTVTVLDTSRLSIGKPVYPSEMATENLSMRVEPSCSGQSFSNLTCASSAVHVSSWATDSLVRHLDLTGFNHGIDIARSASRITVTEVTMNRYGPVDNTAGYAIDVAIDGTQVLVHNVKNRGDGKSRSVATESLTPGPNVCLGYEIEEGIQNIGIEPHERYAHGFLNERSRVVSVIVTVQYGSLGHPHTCGPST